MFFRVVQPSRDAFGFQVVLADGRVALSSVPFADRSAALRAIHVVIACLREGVEASLEVDGDQYRCSIRGLDGAVLATGATLPSPAEVDAQLADLLHWVATVERFRVEEPLQVSPSAVGYDLEPRPRPPTPGLQLLEPTRARLFSARIYDAHGEPLLYTPGFPTLFARDEHVEALLASLPDPRRYDRRDDAGRHFVVVVTKNGRELARSRWFVDAVELESAVAWLTALPPDELLADARRDIAGPGFVGYRGAGGQHFFRLDDERGEPLLASHGYASGKARDNGIRSLLKAATDIACYRLAPDGASFTISALNGRQLVQSREFAAMDELERAIAWVRREVMRLGKACGIRLWDSMIIELPHDADDTYLLGAPPASAPEVVDQPLRALGLDLTDRSPIVETTTLVIEAPLGDAAHEPDEPVAPVTPLPEPLAEPPRPEARAEPVEQPPPPEPETTEPVGPPRVALATTDPALEPTPPATAEPRDVTTPEQAPATVPIDLAPPPEPLEQPTPPEPPAHELTAQEPPSEPTPIEPPATPEQPAALAVDEPTPLAPPTPEPPAPRPDPTPVEQPATQPRPDPAPATRPRPESPKPTHREPPRESPAVREADATPDRSDTTPAKLVTLALPRRVTSPVAAPRRDAPKFNAPGQPRPLDLPDEPPPAVTAEPSARPLPPERSQPHPPPPTSIIPRPPERSQPHPRPPTSIVPRPPERSQPHPRPPTSIVPRPPERSQPHPRPEPLPLLPADIPQQPASDLLLPRPPQPTEPPPEAVDVAPAPLIQTKKKRPRLTTAERAALSGSLSGEIDAPPPTAATSDAEAQRISASSSASIVVHSGASPAAVSSVRPRESGAHARPDAPRALPVLIPEGLAARTAAPPAPRATNPAAPPKPPARGPSVPLLVITLLMLVATAATLITALTRGRAEADDRKPAPRTPEPKKPTPPTPTPPPPEPTPEPTPTDVPPIDEPPLAPQLADTACPPDGADDPALGVLVSPSVPVAGKPLRVLAATFASEQPISLQLLAADETPITEAVDLHPRAGLPASALATWTPPAAGDYRILVVAGAARICHPLRVEGRRRRPATRLGPTAVWPNERAWTPGEEALYSAWVRDLFAASDDPGSSFERLDRLTADPARNVLYGALGLGEDRRDGVRLRPDSVELPYALRAYWAWKRRLPFAFRKCTDPRSGQPQQCDDPRSNLAAARRFPRGDDERARARRFFQRILPASVSAGNARAAADDARSDLYPVQIDRRALRPGTLYVDPRGHVLVVAELVPPQDGDPGALHVVDARFDGTIARRRFWEGTVVWHPDPQLGGTGFKRFRPVEGAADSVYPWNDEAIQESPDHADLWTGQADLDARGFHDKVAGLIDPPPWDPGHVLRQNAAALLELVEERVIAVDRAAARAARSRRPIDMPRGLALFDAPGAWDEFATPGADLRLLGALDVVRALPDRVRDQPDLFEFTGDPAAVADALAANLDAGLREVRFTYLRSDGSEWQLSLADLAARSAELERAYNPNDCPERRWGAPEGSDEAATCASRAPAEQQERMEQNRDWFRVRRSAAPRPR